MVKWVADVGPAEVLNSDSLMPAVALTDRSLDCDKMHWATEDCSSHVCKQGQWEPSACEGVANLRTAP